ncbi:XRE family transcriptional regulator [Agrobacterium vitis]|uniref:XRE family transcriptional regulator n=1 Tax=Agrobacterium vitis TaxID=373 RepID=UPI003D2CF923
MARPENIKTPLGQRLTDVRKAIGHDNRKSFAELLGIPADTLGTYERGVSEPNMTLLSAYNNLFGVNLSWLITGNGAMFANTSQIELPEVLKHDFVMMPQYDVRASAGNGLIAVNQMPTSETAFERKFLRDLGGAPDHCFLMWSTGDSMLPTIPDNALLIVDASQTTVDHGRIYVFSVGNAVLVKRANWRMDGRLDLISDNTAGKYPVETFDANRVEDLAVVGRVIFVGHPP